MTKHSDLSSQIQLLLCQMGKIGKAKKQRINASVSLVAGGWEYAPSISAQSTSWFNITSIHKSLSEGNEIEKETVIINNVLILLTEIIDEPYLICGVLEKALRLLNTKVPSRKDTQPAVDNMEGADSFHLPSVHDHEDDGQISIGDSFDSDQTVSTTDSFASEDISEANHQDSYEEDNGGDTSNFAILE